MAAPSPLLPPVFADWFAARGWSLREHQRLMLEAAAAGRSALLIAPTGGGKTLAGFLPSLVDLAAAKAEGSRPADAGVHTLYISPLKALAVDVERNLLLPVRQMGLPISVESRTGDTGVARRQRQRNSPPDMLLTTPEQLALFCAWEGARDYFRGLSCVIIDEAHAIWPSKRGDLLSLGLARLTALAPNLRRVGLSATVEDPAIVQRWLGGDVDLVRGAPGAAPTVEVLVSEGRVPWAGHTAEHAMGEIYQIIRRAKTVLVFVNTRFQAEFAFQKLWELNEDNLSIALHHGSLSAEQRRRVEAAMARGEIRAVVCTSTLDMGIDWGDVDLVIQLAAPKGSSRMVQRIGRANHRLDEPSRAILAPASRFEYLECRAAAEAIEANALDGEPERTGALDVLAQHIMGVACSEPFEPVTLYDEVRGAGPYRDLSWQDFETVVEFVASGGYALRTYDKFKRIVKGSDGRYRARNAAMVLRHRLNIGAIVTPQTISIRVGGMTRKGGSGGGGGGGGRKIGEVEEGYLEQLVPGDTFVFAGGVWRLNGVSGLDAFVSPAQDRDPKMPSWGGSKFPLSTFLARRVRTMMQDESVWASLPTDVCEWLHAQKERSIIAGAEEMLLETFPRGNRFHLVCYPFEGRIAHATLAMLLTRRLDRLGVGPLGFVANDYCLNVWSLHDMSGLDWGALFDEDMLGDDLEAWLDESFMMKRSFKWAALISGLIERRFAGDPGKSGRQVTFSTDLIYDVLRRHEPDHLLLRCARIDAAAGLLDIARLGDLLARVRGRIRHAALERVSPFAVPSMLEIGRERVHGSAQEMILGEAALKPDEDALIAEAMA
jgi:ATP-dependent Lhr-like helicase